MSRPRLSARRLLGIDRGGPPPPQTALDAPWRPWTIPNAIGYLRAVMIVVFVVREYQSRDGMDTLAGVCFWVAGAGDFVDGMAARITGQYSRLGALMDPVLDRVLIVAGVAVCWSYDLVAHWLLAALAIRELTMLLLGQAWVRRGLALRINWPGRIAVAPTMLGIWLVVIGGGSVGAAFVYLGTALAWLATAVYVRDGRAAIRASSST